MKKLAALLAGAVLLVGAASAWALPSNEWGAIDPTAINGIAPSINTSKDFGYYIWTDDFRRTSWHMRWLDSANPTGMFNGLISLENNTGYFASYAFQAGDVNFTSPTGDLFITFMANGTKGLDFTINQTGTPSYVGFDLDYNFAKMDPNHIYIGGIKQTVASLGQDQDFVIAAPVPEPGTMVLLGAGFLALAIYGKRRKNG